MAVSRSLPNDVWMTREQLEVGELRVVPLATGLTTPSQPGGRANAWHTPT